jgi:hypothetical protein
VGWFTCDGAAVNGTTLREFAKEITVTDDGWEAREHEILYVFIFFRLMFAGSTVCIRCMEHSLHLAAKHFIEVISPVSLASVRKKAAAALNLAREGGHLNMEELERALFIVDAANNDDEDSNDYSTGDGLDMDDDPEFMPGDALGKALAFVKQVCCMCFSILAVGTAHSSIFRFGCHLKQETFSSLLARKLVLSLSNSFFGFARDGHHCTSFLIGF